MTDLTHDNAAHAAGADQHQGQREDQQDAAHLLGFRDVAPAKAASAIVVQRVPASAYGNWGAAFADLCKRADVANPFMSPASVKAARVLNADDDLVVLSARNETMPGRPLIGIWVLRRMRDLWSLGIEVLQTPAVPKYECHSAPVLDRDHADMALAALVRHIQDSDGLPHVIRATSWPVVLNGVLPPHVRTTLAEQWQRAVLCVDAAPDGEDHLRASMGSAYKKRTAQERALHRAGCVEIVSLRGADAVAAFADFLKLEQAGWKGKAGTALADLAHEAAYMRASIEAFAKADQLSVDVIRLDGAPVAMGLVVEAGNSSIFWKTAFDERFSRFSPGVLLDMAVTRRLFREGRPMLDSGMMEFTDPDTQIWSGRMQLARASLDLGSGASGWLVRLGKIMRHRLRLLQRWRTR